MTSELFAYTKSVVRRRRRGIITLNSLSSRALLFVWRSEDCDVPILSHVLQKTTLHDDAHCRTLQRAEVRQIEHQTTGFGGGLASHTVRGMRQHVVQLVA